VQRREFHFFHPHSPTPNSPLAHPTQREKKEENKRERRRENQGIKEERDTIQKRITIRRDEVSHYTFFLIE
jgi:hypothetical protein